MKRFFKKINIPRIFKTKKFILLSLLIFFFLSTPVSLHHISNKIEDFIDRKAEEGLKTFEKQTGLKIEWKFLHFNIFTMSVELEGVKVIPLNDFNFQKIQTFNFLNGLQKIKSISARPSIYSLLFEKQIILAKLQIEGGDIYLKTLKPFITETSQTPNVALPINKILIKQTNLNLKDKDHNLIFSQVNSKVFQKQKGVFRFDLFVESFHIKQDSGFKEFTNTNSHTQNKNDLEKEAFQMAFKGLAQNNRLALEDINLKNKTFKSFTDWLDIHFDSKGLKKVVIRSSGSLPSSLIQKGADLLDIDLLAFDSLLSYKLNVQYKRNKGYQGFFEVQGKKAVFKSSLLKSFFLRGRLLKDILAVDGGSIRTQTQGNIDIKKGEWLFKNDPLQFNFSVETDNLSSDFVFKTILDAEDFPVKGDFTGSVHCFGSNEDFFLKCETDGKSKTVSVKPEDQEEILSLHEMNLDLDIEWYDQGLNFAINGEKSDFSKFNFKGKYLQNLDKIEADYSLSANLYEDLKFNTAFPLEGAVRIQNGKLVIERDNLSLTGFFASPFLKIQAYGLKNISSLYNLENNKLKFFNIRGGSPDKTNYAAECDIDFEEEKFVLKSEFPFFDVEDFSEAVQENISWPVKLKGTGTVSFFVSFPWTSPEHKEFQLKGNLFNIFIDKDFFQQAIFDLALQNQKGLIRSLFFKKGQGSIKGTGTFDSRDSLNLDVVGRNLSLERLEWLNDILPFNQSGDVNFNMKIAGTVGSPNFKGDVSISNMFFYSYPVKNSNLKFRIDKSALFFSGNIMDEINVERFVYPFSENPQLEIKGQFADLDLIKILFSKDHIEKTQDYFSKITGSFSFLQNTKTQVWSGLAKINKLFISKSNKWIKNDQPFSIFANEKKWSLTSTKFSHYDKKSLIIENRENDKLFLSGESSLGLFSALLPFVKELDGDIKGQLLMDNNLKKIDPRGSLQIQKGLFSLSPLPDFTNIRTSLIFSKNNMFINDFIGNMGGGWIEGRGTVFYNFVNLPRVNLNLSFSDTRFNIPEDFNTKGNGKIQIKGEKTPYLISGQYIIDSGNITKDFLEGDKKTKYNFSFLEEKEEREASLFKLKLNIKTKQALAVNNSLIRSSIEGETDIYGPLNSLLMKGRFVLPQNKEENLIFFRGHEFRISSGSVTFENSTPENPYLNIKANTLFRENVTDPLRTNTLFEDTITGPLENQQEIERIYKIFLSLRGPTKNPKFSLESSPFLNEKEIISLLTLGAGSRHFDASVKKNFADYSYQVLAALLLEKPLNRGIRNALGLDFRLTPYINDSNEPVTKITLSRNLFEKWKTSFSRTIEDEAQSDIRLKYNLNQKVSLTTFWENTEQREIEDEQEDRLGLDLEFNFDF